MAAMLCVIKGWLLGTANGAILAKTTRRGGILV
jgi:hypothetical protein